MCNTIFVHYFCGSKSFLNHGLLKMAASQGERDGSDAECGTVFAEDQSSAFVPTLGESQQPVP